MTLVLDLDSALESGNFDICEIARNAGKEMEVVDVSKYPLFKGDHNLIKTVFEQEAAITKADDEFPLIGTFGLISCICLAGYDHKEKTGFVTHFVEGTDIDSSIYKIKSKNRITHRARIRRSS